MTKKKSDTQIVLDILAKDCDIHKPNTGHKCECTEEAKQGCWGYLAREIVRALRKSKPTKRIRITLVDP